MIKRDEDVDGWVNGTHWARQLHDLADVEKFVLAAFAFSGPVNNPIELYPASDPEWASLIVKALVFRAWANHLVSCPISDERRGIFVSKLREALITCQKNYSSLLNTEPTTDENHLLKSLKYAGFAIPLLELTDEDGIDFSWTRSFLKRFEMEEGGFPYTEYDSSIGEDFFNPYLFVTKDVVHSLLLMGEDNATLFNRCVNFILSMHKPNSSLFKNSPDGAYDFFGTLHALPTLLSLGEEVPDRELIIDYSLLKAENEEENVVKYAIECFFILNEFSLLKECGAQDKLRVWYKNMDISQDTFFGDWALFKTSVWSMVGISPSDFDFKLSPAKIPLKGPINFKLQITNRHPRPRSLILVGIEPLEGSCSFEIEDFPFIQGEVFAGDESRELDFLINKTSSGPLQFNLVSQRAILNYKTKTIVKCNCSTVFQLEEGEEEKNRNNSALIIAGAILGGLLVIGSTTATIVSLRKRKRTLHY